MILVQLGEGISTGYWAEQNGKASKFYFSENLSVLAGKTKALREVVNQGGVEASRIVGNFGLGYTLARMGMQQNLGVNITSKVDLETEPFYQVVLTSTKDNLEFVLKNLQDKALKAEVIGAVEGQSLKFENESVDVAQLKELYETSWSKAFPRL